jgi:ribose transport system permease protein
VTTIVEKESQTVIKSAVFSQGAWQKILAFASLIALMAVFSIASDNFLQPDNLIGILQATAVNGVLAVATTFVIITGGIDLSIGTLMTFCAVIAGVFLTYWGLPMPVGILAAIAAGALCGSVSGTLIAKMKIPPFIATLGMMLLLKGLALVISGTRPIYFNELPDDLAGVADRGNPAVPADPQRCPDPLRGRGRLQPCSHAHRSRPLHLCPRLQ